MTEKIIIATRAYTIYICVQMSSLQILHLVLLHFITCEKTFFKVIKILLVFKVKWEVLCQLKISGGEK